MSKILLPTEAPEYPSIVVQTRRGTGIANSQPTRATVLELRQADELRRRYNACFFRTGPIPFYNCHGLTFASRRTRLWEPASIRTILIEDGYSEIPRERASAGDVVLYTARSGEVEHSGVVLEVPPLPFLPMVLSKWGGGPEVVHSIAACPYDSSNLRFYRILE